jgi:hypothetical protein
LGEADPALLQRHQHHGPAGVEPEQERYRGDQLAGAGQVQGMGGHRTLLEGGLPDIRAAKRPATAVTDLRCEGVSPAPIGRGCPFVVVFILPSMSLNQQGIRGMKMRAEAHS